MHPKCCLQGGSHISTNGKSTYLGEISASHWHSSQYYHCLLNLENLELILHLQSTLRHVIIRKYVRSFIFCPDGKWLESNPRQCTRFHVANSPCWVWMQITVIIHKGAVVFSCLNGSTISWCVLLSISFTSRIFINLISSSRKTIWETF